MDIETAKGIGTVIGYCLTGGATAWSFISSRRSKHSANKAEASALSLQDKTEVIDKLETQVTQLEAKVNFQDQEIVLLKSSNLLVSNNFDQAKRLLDDVQRERDILHHKNNQLERDKKVLYDQLQVSQRNEAAITLQLNEELKENSRLQGEIQRLDKALESQAERLVNITALLKDREMDKVELRKELELN
jgi:septal ring factor EnvC (AmiA/AmiB activator)